MKKFAIIERPNAMFTQAAIMSLVSMFKPNENPSGYIDFNMTVDEAIAYWQANVSTPTKDVEGFKRLLLGNASHHKDINLTTRSKPGKNGNVITILGRNF